MQRFCQRFSHTCFIGNSFVPPPDSFGHIFAKRKLLFLLYLIGIYIYSCLSLSFCNSVILSFCFSVNLSETFTLVFTWKQWVLELWYFHINILRDTTSPWLPTIFTMWPSLWSLTYFLDNLKLVNNVLIVQELWYFTWINLMIQA